MRFFVFSAFALALLANSNVSAYKKQPTGLQQDSYGGSGAGYGGVGAEEAAIDEYSNKKAINKGVIKDGWAAEKRLEKGNRKYDKKDEYSQEGPKGPEYGAQNHEVEGGEKFGKLENSYGRPKSNKGPLINDGYGAEGGKGHQEGGFEGGKGPQEGGFEGGKDGFGEGGKDGYGAEGGKGGKGGYGKNGKGFEEGGFEQGKGGYGKGGKGIEEAGFEQGKGGYGKNDKGFEEGGFEQGKGGYGKGGKGIEEGGFEQGKGGYGKGGKGFEEAGFEQGKGGYRKGGKGFEEARFEQGKGGYGKGGKGIEEGGFEQGKGGFEQGGYGQGGKGPGKGGFGEAGKGFEEGGYGQGGKGPGKGGFGKAGKGGFEEGGYGQGGKGPGKGGFGEAGKEGFEEGGYGQGGKGFGKGGKGGFEEGGYGQGGKGFGKGGKEGFGGPGIVGGIEGYDGPRGGHGQPGFDAGWKGGYGSGMMPNGPYGGMMPGGKGGFGGFDELPRPFGHTKMTVKTCNKMMDTLLGHLQVGYTKRIAPVVKLPMLPPTPIGSWGRISFYDGAFQNLKGKICRGGDFKVIPQGDTVLVSGIVSIPEPRIRYQADAFLYSKLKIRNRPLNFCAKNADFRFQMAVNKKAGRIQIADMEPLKIDDFHLEDEKGDPKHLVWPFNKLQGPMLEDSKITFANQLTGVLCDEFRTMVKRPEVKQEIISQV